MMHEFVASVLIKDKRNLSIDMLSGAFTQGSITAIPVFSQEMIAFIPLLFNKFVQSNSPVCSTAFSHFTLNEKGRETSTTASPRYLGEPGDRCSKMEDGGVKHVGLHVKLISYPK